MPRPLVPRPWRREVAERLAPDGTVEIPLDIDALLREVERHWSPTGSKAWPWCSCTPTPTPSHERLAAAALTQRFPQLSLSLSSDIAPEIREYPRASTTVANAYVRPLAERYLDRLEARLRDLGIAAGASPAGFS